MDENESLLSPEQEISSPSPQTELNEPSPLSELSSAQRTEEYFAEHRESAGDGGEKKRGLTRRVIRYVAATAAAVGLLAETAPAPSPTPEIEYVGTQSHIVIECAAVLPDEPEILCFSDYSNDPMVGAADWNRQYIIVEPDGTEREIPGYDIRPDAEHSRYCFIREEDAFSDEGNPAYRLFSYDEDVSAYRSDPDWLSVGNVGFHMSLVQPGEIREGSALKIAETYRIGETWYQVSSVRKITPIPPEPEISVSLTAEPLGDGFSQAHFRAVVHPREGDEHDYYFGTRSQLYAEHPDAVNAQQTGDGEVMLDGMDSLRSFCVRWYDDAHAFLGEGWFYSAPYSIQPRIFPEVSHAGRDFIFEYDGLVQSSSPNDDAAFYTLELNIVDVSTGWHYLIETEQLPTTD